MRVAEDYLGSEQLVLRARAGDSHAFDQIVERFGRLVWWMALQVGVDHATAADVSQITWLRLVERLDTITNPGGIGSWLATTARREAIAASRRAGREAPMTVASETATTDELDEHLLATEAHVAVRRAYAALDERCRELLKLVTADPPMPYDDISAITGLAVGSIGPIRGRCIARLKRLLAENEAP